jgi:hypothetical protein
MTALYLKVFVGLLLFAVWVWLSIVPYPNTGPIISFIQLVLGGLAHHLTTTAVPVEPPQTPPAIVQSITTPTP